MTVIKDALQNPDGTPDFEEGAFAEITLPWRNAGTGATGTDAPLPILITEDGLETPDLQPGRAVIRLKLGELRVSSTYEVVIPDSPTPVRLWDVIATAVLIPPDTPAELVALAVQSYLTANPPAGGGDLTKEVADATYVPAFPASTIAYNGAQQPVSVTTDGIATTYTYNSDGTVATDTRAGVTRYYSYDANGNPTTISTTPAVAPPAAVGTLTLTPATGQIGVAHAAPSSAASITDYLYRYRLQGGSSWTTFADGTSATPGTVITGRTPGAIYEVQAAAVSSGGQGAWSATATATVPASVPAAISNLAASPGNATAALTWSAPASDASITDYVVQLSTDGGTSYTTYTDSVTATTGAALASLTNDQAYRARVAAVSSAGQGPWSNVVVFTPTAGVVSYFDTFAGDGALAGRALGGKTWEVLGASAFSTAAGNVKATSGAGNTYGLIDTSKTVAQRLRFVVGVLGTGTASHIIGAVIRAVSEQNGIELVARASTTDFHYKLQRRNGTTSTTQLGSLSAALSAAGDIVDVVDWRSTSGKVGLIEVYVNGSLAITATDTSFNTATKYGLYGNGSDLTSELSSLLITEDLAVA